MQHSMEHWKQAISVISRCAMQCENCAIHCIEDRDRPDCAKACLDCAHACEETCAALARDSSFAQQYLGHCAAICDGCAKIAEQYDNEHCRMTVEMCRECEHECRSAIHTQVA